MKSSRVCFDARRGKRPSSTCHGDSLFSDMQWRVVDETNGELEQGVIRPLLGMRAAAGRASVAALNDAMGRASKSAGLVGAS